MRVHKQTPKVSQNSGTALDAEGQPIDFEKVRDFDESDLTLMPELEVDTLDECGFSNMNVYD